MATVQNIFTLHRLELGSLPYFGIYIGQGTGVHIRIRVCLRQVKAKDAGEAFEVEDKHDRKNCIENK